MTNKYRAAAPGEPGLTLTKAQVKEIRAQEARTQRRIRQRATEERRRAAKVAAIGTYDQNRPNHFFHDSLGDPEMCTGNHNHPRDIGE